MTSDAGERPTADVRVLAESELAAVEQQIDFDWGNPGKHRDRLREQQAGEAAYLVAWYGKQPIGHALVKWNGPTHRAIAATLGRCAEIEDLFVHPSYRSTGVGSKLLEYATKLAKQQGLPIVGLGVATDNPRARKLYERIGFNDTGFGEYTTHWPWHGRDGQEQWAQETCNYLARHL